MKVRQIAYEGVGGLNIKHLQTYKNLKASLKYDGGQYQLHISNERAYALTSKRISKKTDMLSDRIENFPELKDVKFSGLLGETIICCEVSAEHLYKQFVKEEFLKPDGTPYLWSNRANFVTSIMNAKPETVAEKYPDGNPLRLIAFSVLYHNGMDIRNWTYIDKYEFLQNHFPSAGLSGGNVRLTNKDLVYSIQHFPASRILKVDKNAFDEGIIREDFRYEGFVVVEPLTMRSFKVKKMSEADVIVIGYDWNSTGKYAENNWIKSIIVGTVVSPLPVYINKGAYEITKADVDTLFDDGIIVEVGKVSGFDEQLRVELSTYPNTYLGKVLQTEYMEWTGNRMRHPRIGEKGFRDDQRIDRCKYSQFEI